MRETRDILGGVVIEISLNENHSQDFLEIKLLNGETIILTSSPGGKIKIGNKIVELDSPQEP